MPLKEYGLGRVHAPDERDKQFSMSSVLPPAKEVKRIYRYWNAEGWWGNQLLTPQCVGYAWAHWIEDGPVTYSGPLINPTEIYKEAQKRDVWAGENYNGTSVRGGAKYLQEKGFIGEYLWAWDLQALITAVLTTGPVVVGTSWYMDMFNPINGIIRVGGAFAGGHAYKVDGVNTKTKLFRCKNSWGREWGKQGFFYVTFKDMERLIKEDGEICLAIEIKQAA